MNQVALVGRITKDPVLRELARGRVQSSFFLAVNRNYKNTKGEVECDFILCTVWGKLAENTVKHCGKGSLIGVGGRIQSRTYEREDRGRVYVTEVIGEDIRFIATKTRASDNLSEKPTAKENAEGDKEEDKYFHLPKRENEGLPIM